MNLKKGLQNYNTVSGISLHSFYADVENKLQVGEIKETAKAICDKR